MGYRGYGLPISEVISEGNVGLMHAVKRFEPDKGFPPRDLRDVVDPRRHPGIRAALVVAGEDRHDRGAEASVLQPAQGEGPDRRARRRQPAPRPDQADRDDAARHRSRRRLDEPAPHGDASLNAPMRADEGASEWQDWLVDDTPDQETTLGNSEEYTERMGLLTNAMSDLNDREKAIFQARRLQDNPATLEELAQEYNVSRERIRQIEVRAFEKVQEAMQKAAHASRAKPASEN